MFSEIDDYIRKEIEKHRLGVYVGILGAQLDKFNRTEILPSFLREPLKRVRKISSPIMDVEGLKGSNVAVISQDGVISFPLNVGTVFDDVFGPDQQTVWIRARLQKNPGVLDIGTTLGFRLIVGSEKEDLKPIAKDKISIGNGTGELVSDTHSHAEQFSKFLDKLPKFVEAVATAKTVETAAVAGGTPPNVAAQAKDLAVEAAKNAIFPSIISAMTTIKSNLNSLKE